MANSSLTPLQMNAGSGLLQNQGLIIAPTFTVAINSYNNTPTITALRQAMAIAGNTYPGLYTIGAATCPALGDAVPAAYSSLPTSSSGWVNSFITVANRYLGNGDLSKFAQAEAICQGYIDQVNPFINSSVNSQTYLKNTFSDTNNMVTGDITAVNKATTQWGADLVNLGRLINLQDLDALGSPLALTKQLAAAGSLTPSLALAFYDANVPLDIVVNISDPNLAVADSVQKSMYTAMTKITGTSLAEVLAVLKVKTAGITTMADLLNPYKIFPNSFLTLTVTTTDGVSKKIYLDNQGTVNLNVLSGLPTCDDCACTPLALPYARLSTIIPPDQAAANKALSYSWSQIAGINNMKLEAFAASVSGIQSMVGLPLVNAQTSAVPAPVANYYAGNIAKGTSVNGTFVICDFLGTAAGVPGTVLLANTVAQMNTMDLSSMTACYTTTVNALNGVYNVPNATEPTANDIVIPSGLPAAGTYQPILAVNPSPPPNYIVVTPAITFAMAALIAASNSTVASLVATYPTQTGILNANWNKMGLALTNEAAFQAKANLVFANLVANNQQSLFSLTQSLPGMSTDTAVGAQVEFFTKIADQSNLTGQSIVGLFRQGNTTIALNSVGITNSNNIPVDPSPPPSQAKLGPTTYPYP